MNLKRVLAFAGIMLYLAFFTSQPKAKPTAPTAIVIAVYIMVTALIAFFFGILFDKLLFTTKKER